MRTLESLVSHLASGASFRAAFAADPEAALAARGLTLTDAERESVARLRPLLALPTDADSSSWAILFLKDSEYSIDLSEAVKVLLGRIQNLGGTRQKIESVVSFLHTGQTR